jgi:hypothetical protein
MKAARVVAFAACCSVCAAIDMKWTPNGEGPAPFSTKARQQMGVDPAAMAGQAQAQGAPGGGLGFSLGMLAVIYLSNNWKIVMALQHLVMQFLAPFLQANGARQEAVRLKAQQAEMERARLARLERLKAKTASD